MTANVLIVENDVATVRVLSKLLESIGFTVRVSRTVASGIAELKNEPVLIVLTSILPDGNGLDVLAALRARGQLSKVAVVSEVTNPAQFSRLQSLNPDAIFGKPLDFDDFVDWISLVFTDSPLI